MRKPVPTTMDEAREYVDGFKGGVTKHLGTAVLNMKEAVDNCSDPAVKAAHQELGIALANFMAFVALIVGHAVETTGTEPEDPV